MTPLQHASYVLDKVASRHREVILFYSGGKDSMVLLDLAAPKFDRVVLVFMYLVKGLDHIDAYLKWALARYPNTELLQVPHYNLTNALKFGLYCRPNKNITRRHKLADLDKYARVVTGIPFTLYGWKQSDGMQRMITLRTYEDEAIAWEYGRAYPLTYLKKGEVLAYCRMRGMPEPVQYSKKRGNGLDFTEECLVWMRDNYPQDLVKFLKKFPYAERLVFEYDYRMANPKQSLPDGKD